MNQPCYFDLPLTDFVGQAPSLRGALSPASLFKRRPGRPPQAKGLPHIWT